MDLLLGTLTLRPYVFAFVALFVVAGIADLGWRRTLLFAAWVWPVAWLAEFSSTRTGLPFGLYHYTGVTHGQEIYLADVPLMDSLSFTFLAYASLCLARAALAGRDRAVSAPGLALLSGTVMMLLDVVVDPLAVRGDRWFLGRIFFYPAGGAYFGVPISNFLGWIFVGTVGVGGYLALSGLERRRAGTAPPPPSRRGAGGAGVIGLRDAAGAPERSPRVPVGAVGRRVWPGVALYYVVLAFNLAVTGWIGEWVLLLAGCVLHASLGLMLLYVRRWPAVATGLETQRA